MDIIDELRDENRHLKNTLAEIEAENSRLKDKCEQLGNATTQLESNLLQQSTELQRLHDENARLDKDLARTSDDFQELNNRTVHLASENSRLGAESIVANGDIGKLRGQVVQARNDIRHLTKAAKDEAAEARKDLIRRFVAIAISVGFATQIVSMGVIDHWAKAIDQWPSWWPSWTLIPKVDEPLLETMFRLCTSMVVILLGWDWYDRDLRAKPLTQIGRFILDAIIVSAELILLLSSSHPRLWAVLLIVIFGLYIVWDIFSIIDCPSYFGFAVSRDKWWCGPRDILGTYFGALRYPERRGPPINLTWFVYFLVVLLVLPRFVPFPGVYGGFVTCLMVILGASLLWCEGVRRKDNQKPLISFGGRVAALVSLGILYGLLRALLA